jgi:trehalose 6-phosphate phosphatase
LFIAARGDTSRVFDELLTPLRGAPAGAGVLSDIDGTLAPIVARAEDAAVPERARRVLAELAGRYALVACVSGRRAADARRLVGVDDLVYAGNHGFELLLPGEPEPQADPVLAGRLDAAPDFVRALDEGEVAAAELRLEDKGPIQALHWRGAADGERAQSAALAIAADAQAAGLVPRWGRKVLELRPVAGIDKGSVVVRLVRDRGLAHALFGGDDTTDLDAFTALRRMRGDRALETAVCVGVDSDEAPAGLEEATDLLVGGTEGYLAILEALAA